MTDFVVGALFLLGAGLGVWAWLRHGRPDLWPWPRGARPDLWAWLR
jgi:drug/metabolite transporter superfamily protein YnfA